MTRITADYWKLVHAVVEYAGGGMTWDEFANDGEISVGDVISLLIENHNEFGRAGEQLREAKVEVKRLNEWKASAERVMAPMQEIAKKLGVPLGTSISQELARLVETQAAEIVELKRRLALALDACGGEFDEAGKLRLELL